MSFLFSPTLSWGLTLKGNNYLTLEYIPSFMKRYSGRAYGVKGSNQEITKVVFLCENAEKRSVAVMLISLSGAVTGGVANSADPDQTAHRNKLMWQTV